MLILLCIHILFYYAYLMFIISSTLSDVHFKVPQRMIECGLATDEEDANKRASQLIQAAVHRAKSAITKYNTHNKGDGRAQKKIAGCVPPLSECYFANKVPLELNRLISEYTIILTTLLDCKIDILLAETLSTAREAIAILNSLSNIIQQNKAENKKCCIPPLWISFTIHDDKPTNLRSDEILEEACSSIIQEASKLNLPLDAIGVNCSTPTAISTAIPILVKVTEGSNIKVSAYGNCFQTTTSEWMNSLDDNEDGKKDTAKEMTNIYSSDYDEEGYLTPDAYTKFALEWIKSGAQIIGGCCGSRPAHIHKVAAAIKSK